MALRALLFQVEPTDPWPLIEVVALLIVVWAAASLGPALAAARTDSPTRVGACSAGGKHGPSAPD